MAAEPRVFFGTLVPPHEREQLWRETCAHGLDEKLDHRQLFMPENWHQSLGGAHFSPSAELIQRLREAGAEIAAYDFALLMNRIGSTRYTDPFTGKEKFHWEFRARGRPDGFADVLVAVQRALAMVGLASGEGHTPHVTLSYNAPSKLPTKQIEPVRWLIDEIQLIEGSGSPYRYRVIDRWPLSPREQAPYAQLSMFG